MSSHCACEYVCMLDCMCIFQALVIIYGNMNNINRIIFNNTINMNNNLADLQYQGQDQLKNFGFKLMLYMPFNCHGMHDKQTEETE